LLLALAVGVSLVFLYPDADQQDAGYHYLFARWSWILPKYLISVWARPLFTLAYAVPALGGYPVAKLFTVLISIVTAWQTVRAAKDLGIQNSELTVPFIFLQPAVFLVSSVTLTEPLFALIFVLALRLDLRGRRPAGAFVASLLVLVRPEGFFVCLAWGVWLLVSGRNEVGIAKRFARVSLLGLGALVWWGATFAVSGDPLWLVHNWPADWRPVNEANVRGPVWWYIAILPLIVGPLLLPQFVLGIVSVYRKRRLVFGLAVFGVVWSIHALMFARGWFGDAGYPRYLVCVSPITALATLEGWNRIGLPARRSLSVVILLLSFVICLFYVDGFRFTRDSRAIDDALNGVNLSETAWQKLVFSQSYACIRLGCTPSQWLPLAASKEQSLALLEKVTEPTLVVWDADVGPKWYGLISSDFESRGFRTLFRRDYSIYGWFLRLPWKRHGGPRLQTIQILYREAAKEAKRQ